MPRIGERGTPVKKPSQPKCVACGGTGKSSKGRDCVPCKGKGVLLATGH